MVYAIGVKHQKLQFVVICNHGEISGRATFTPVLIVVYAINVKN